MKMATPTKSLKMPFRPLAWLRLLLALLGISEHALAQTNWVTRNPGINGYFTGLAFGNGLYVVTGQQGVIVTSPDGTNWTSRNSGTSTWIGKVAFGNSTFVANGQNGLILTSPDAISWTPRSSGTTANFGGIDFFNGQFITVGDKATIATSPDGINWTLQNSGISDPNSSRGGLDWVAYGNGLYVISGGSSTILTSPDTLHWTQHDLGGGSTSVVFGNGIFVIIAYQSHTSSALLTSPDGLNWTPQNSLPFQEFGATFAGGTFVGAAGDTGHGAGAYIVSSSDGTNWVQRVSLGNNLWNVKYVNGTFMAVGENGTILQSAPFPSPPFLIGGPTGQTIPAGSNLTFNTTVVGSPPLLYQWRFNGTNLIGQTNSFLALTNLTWNQTGFYSVTISNGYGSVTSANAILVVADFLHGNRFYYDHEDRLVGAEYLRGISIAYVYDGNGNLVRQAVLSRASETDGLPVLWRFLNGLSPTDNSGVNAPYADADGDGWSNYAEWVAGTNPTNAQSMPTNAPNSMPVAVVMPGTNVLGPQANVPIVMSNALGNPSVPYLQYQFSGSTVWQNATLLNVDSNAYSTNLRVAAWPTGTSHVLVWDALGDLGFVVTNVLFQAQAMDVAMTGAWSTPPVAYAVNTLPPFQMDPGSTNLQITVNGFQFPIAGLNGTGPLVIYASTNLSNWNAIFTNTNPPIGTMLFLDPSATNLSWRFYKATEP